MSKTETSAVIDVEVTSAQLLVSVGWIHDQTIAANKAAVEVGDVSMARQTMRLHDAIDTINCTLISSLAGENPLESLTSASIDWADVQREAEKLAEARTHE